MDFIEKTNVCSNLAAAKFIAADKALLRTVQPDDNLLHAIGSGNDFDKQLLWVLLDHVKDTDIIAARAAVKIDTVKTTTIVPPTTDGTKKKSSSKRGRISKH